MRYSENIFDFVECNIKQIYITILHIHSHKIHS